VVPAQKIYETLNRQDLIDSRMEQEQKYMSQSVPGMDSTLRSS
jgi:hypothetical protein